MKILFRYTVLTMFCLLIGLSGCARQEERWTPDLNFREGKVVVYATIYPIYDFVQKIGGDYVEVTQIIPPSTDAHHFEPSAKLLAKLAQADLIVYNGANMEPWISKVQDVLRQENVTFVNASHNIPLLKMAEEEHEHDQEGFQPGFDPHVWLSPQNAILQGQAICDALIEIDHANEAYYLQNYTQLAAELAKLDQEFREALGESRRKEFVVAHDSFGYLAKEYGLTQIPIRGLAADAEPSPTKLREIISLVQSYDLTYVFYESLTDSKPSQVIAKELGVGTLELNPLGNLTEEQIKQGEDYFSVMRSNLANLMIALSEDKT